MYRTVSCALHAPAGFSFAPLAPVMPVKVHPGLETEVSLGITVRAIETYTKRWAVTLA